ncbi:MAG: hypothetical protein HOV80_12935 [Polyangiaceae bacterium]|nr:hypothetical protein [Polyangiaceae bacterium]
MALTRKHFIQAALGVTGTAALAAACGDDEGSGGSNTATTGPTGPVTIGNGPSSSTGVQMGCGTTIGTNHPQGAHSMMVSEADVNAGVDKTYDITGASMHMHEVTVTAADFTTLAAQGGGTITVTSTMGGAHTHSITVSCNIG